MNKKYELTTKTKKIDGHKVYRIKALKSFKTIIGRRVNKGDLGGWVESEENLSQEGLCWLFDEAAGYENSRRSGNSVGYGNSRQYGNSWQFDNSWQAGDSRQYGFSRQFGSSRQYGSSWQFGNSRQYGASQQYDSSGQYGDSQQSGDSVQSGDSMQFGSSVQSGNSRQYDSSRQYGSSVQSGNSVQYGSSVHLVGDDDGTGRILCISPCGDSQRTVTVQPDNTIVAGCFRGNFKEFKQAVVAKYGKDYGSYFMCIKILNMALKYRLAQKA